MWDSRYYTTTTTTGSDDEERKRRSREEALNNYSADFHLANALIGHRARPATSWGESSFTTPSSSSSSPLLCRYSSSSSSSVFFLVVDVGMSKRLILVARRDTKETHLVFSFFLFSSLVSFFFLLLHFCIFTIAPQLTTFSRHANTSRVSRRKRSTRLPQPQKHKPTPQPPTDFLSLLRHPRHKILVKELTVCSYLQVASVNWRFSIL